jgi:non-heme chloroperoxidase
MRDPNYQSQTITSINLWKMIPNISCPTLIIRGANSDVFNDNTMTRMQEAIPQCQIKTVPNAGHLVQGDNPVNFLEVYSQFLSELD